MRPSRKYGLAESFGVADGDTLTVLEDAKHQHKIRLAGIDAPERKQPFYRASRQKLYRLAFGKSVAVEWHKGPLRSPSWEGADRLGRRGISTG
jgi:endonuclease YncB( thermonuclease family)